VPLCAVFGQVVGLDSANEGSPALKMTMSLAGSCLLDQS
jgi:hypothetical protein